MGSPSGIPERNKINTYDINYYRAVFALAVICYLILSFYLVPADKSIKEFIVEGKYISILPFSLLVLTFLLPQFNRYLPIIINSLFLFSTLHLLGFIAINEFAGKYETILIALILISNLHLERIIFVVLYNVITLTVLEYVFIMTAPSANIQPVMFFAFLMAAMIVSIPYQLYRIRYKTAKKEKDILNEGLLKGNPDAWLLLEGPGLVVIEASDKALELFGIKSEPEFEQISLRSLIASTTTLEADNIIRGILSNESFDTVTLCRKISGELFHADVSAYKIPGEKKYIQCRFIETSKSRWSKENMDATENALRYRSYLDLAETGIIICDNTGKIKICNKYSVQLFKKDNGHNYSDQHLSQLTGNETSEIILQLFNSLKLKQAKLSNELIDTGNSYKLNVTVSHINDIIDLSDEMLIHVKKQDLHENKWNNPDNTLLANEQAEHQLIGTSIFTLLPSIITDLKGNITDSNHKFRTILGYSADDVISLKIERIIHPEDQIAFQKFTQANLNGSTTAEAELRIIGKTGQTIYFNTGIEKLQGVDNQIRYIFYNINQYKNTNEALLEANSNVTAVVENTDDPIFSVDFNHRITVMNVAFINEYLKRTGRKPVTGDDYRTLIPRSELSLWNNCCDLAMKGNKSKQQEIIKYSDNSNEYFETSFHPITTKDHLVIGVSVHSRKVTERIQFERQIIEAKEIAEKATNAKSDFLATMSHEIRTPLNGLLGMSDLLNSTPMTAEQKEFVDSIQLSGQALLSVINDVLDYSRIESEKMELEQVPFEIKSVITETFNILNYKAKEQGNRLEYEVSKNLPHYYIGDKARLRQILVNLVGNAIKFTTNGSISVNIEGQLTSPGKWELKFSVKDTGIGMSEDQIKKLFQSFSQADETTFGKYGGSGLGLAISSKLTNLMHGKMWVESITGEGSVFFFTAKLNESEKDKIASSSTSAAPTRNPEENKQVGKSIPLNILVAEDNMVNQTLAKATFKNLGYKIDVAENGQKAVELTIKNNYDLIFMDVQMPILNGMEATQVIHQKLVREKWPVIVAMTAFALEGDREKCINAGMDDYISKPFIIEDIKRIILKYGGQLLNQKSYNNENVSQEETLTVAGIQLIDFSMIERLKVMADDDAGFLAQLVDLFISQSDETVAELKELLRQKDLTKLSQAAHKLKGSSLNLGAKQLAEICKQIEIGIENNDEENVKNQIQLIDNIYTLTKTALKKAAEIK